MREIGRLEISSLYDWETMAEVIPFKGILYNTAKVLGSDVVAPPYDIITPELRKSLHEKSPYNIVKIDYGEEYPGDNETENKYTRAAHYLNLWLTEGPLTKSGKACFYAYEMKYKTGGKDKKLFGLFGLVKLEELGKGVYPHEKTHSKPKADRLSLMTACRANTSPIFSIYNSPEKKASGVIETTITTEPYMEAKDLDGAVHRLWLIENDEDINTIEQDLKGKAIFIADGHHRYETALEYQRIIKQESPQGTGTEQYNYVMMFLANIADGGLTILPTHRVVRHTGEDVIEILKKYFKVTSLSRHDDVVDAIRGEAHTFGLYLKEADEQYVLKYSGEGLKEMAPVLKYLDVTILHDLIFKDLLNVSDILYEMDPATAKIKASEGIYNAVFFLNPTKVEDVERVALSSLRMPPKSTYFYPKIMTGFVINSLKNSI